MVPSFVNSQFPLPSFHRIATVEELPLLTSTPAFCVGATLFAKSLFRVIILSAIFNSLEFTVVVVPDTVKSPCMVTLFENVSA